MELKEQIKQALMEIPALELAKILGKDFLPTLISQLSESEKAALFGRAHLSNTAIVRHRELGNIVIEPFNPWNLHTATYDVRLGQYYYAEQNPSGGRTIFNIYDPEDVKQAWGDVQVAQPLRLWLKKRNYEFEQLTNISPDDLVIPISPGGTVLGHTIEYVGGRNGIMTSHMKARSTMGRCFMEVCKCAGEGDVGFFNRWTMEFTNNSEYKWIPLVVGRRVAQMIFIHVEPITGEEYGASGKYQLSRGIEQVKKSWRPEDMLPKLWKDCEVRENILGTTFLTN